MEDAVSFLKERIETGTQQILDSVTEMIIHHNKFTRARTDVRAYQGALEALTRDDPQPYKPEDLPQVVFDYRGVLAFMEHDPAEPAAVEPADSEESDEDEDSDTEDLTDEPRNMAQAVRMLFAESFRPLSIDDLIYRSQRFDGMRLTRHYLYRLLPRLLDRGEIRRVSRGLHIWAENEQFADNNLFSDEEEE